MSITNVLLVRTAYGWDEVVRQSSIDAHGRHEALYGLGSYSSPADVQDVGGARLDIIAEARYQYQAEHAPPDDADLAYHAYGTGDTLVTTAPGGSPSAERVLALAVSEDDVGNATVTPSLNDIVLWASPLENFVAMLSTAVKKMIPGTGRGDWKEAQPVTPPSVAAPTPNSPGTSPFVLTGGFATGATEYAYTYSIGLDPAWSVCYAGFDGDVTISLLTSGRARIGGGACQTPPVFIPGGASVIFGLARYAADGSLLSALDTPTISHAAFTDPLTQIEAVTDPSGTPFLNYYFSDLAAADASSAFTLGFSDVSSGCAWVVYLLEPGDGSSPSHDDFANGNGTGSLGVAGDHEIAFVMTSAPAVHPVIGAGWTTVSV